MDKPSPDTVLGLCDRAILSVGLQVGFRRSEITMLKAGDLHFNRSVPFAPYAKNKRLGAFIVTDKLTNETVGAGMIHFALRREEYSVLRNLFKDLGDNLPKLASIAATLSQGRQGQHDVRLRAQMA